MKKLSLLILLAAIALWLSPAQLHAQGGDAPPSPGLQPTLHFTHLTTADGLSHNFVRTILQDRQGFMWIGTEGGLNRYDGYESTVYQYDHNDPNSLSDNFVRDLYEDAEGNIWVATQGGGVNRFDPLTETFTRYRHDPENPNSLAGDAIFSIFQDSRGNFWFGGPPVLGDLTRYDPTTETFTRYSRPEGFEAGGVWDMVEDESGNLWLAADFVLVRFNPETEQFTYFAPDPVDQRLAVLHQAGDGTFWVGGSEGLYRFNPQTGDFTLHQPGRSVGVNDILPNDNGAFWIGTRHGLYLFDPTVSRFTHEYQPDPTYQFSLSHDNVQDLYRDQAGVLWIGTGNGLDLYDPRQSQFTHYRRQPGNPNTLAGEAVWDVAGDQDGSLWVGAGAALNRLDLATGQVAHYPFKATSRPDVPTVGAIFPNQDGFVWVGTETTLYRFDKARGEFTAAYDMQSSRPPGGPPIEINSLYHDGSVLWVGVLRGGLIRFDLQSETFQTYHEPPSELTGVADPHYFLHLEVTTIYGDREGYIWLGYGTGELSRFDPKSNTFIHFRPDANDPHSISTGWITDIHQDQAGMLWLTSRRGLTRFDPSAGPSSSSGESSGQAPQAESFKLYTEKDGLPGSYVTGIRQDNQGNLWLATLKGLSKFDPHTETFRNYDVADGVGSAEFWGASWQSADGRMFFGGNDGLTAFYPDQISDSPYQPPVVLTSFSLFNQPVTIGEDSLLKQPLWKTDHLTLQYDQNSITFGFAALSYAASYKNRYRYKLEGLEENWNEVGSDHRLAAYTNLPAGEYPFRSERNGDGHLIPSTRVYYLNSVTNEARLNF